MNKPQPRPAFDQHERARIQRGLRHYMAQHRIGTPTLQRRIEDADTPQRRELPLSTLQRFITGSHRTSDAYVEMCRNFLETAGASTIEQPPFGAALAGFFGDGGNDGEALKRAASLAADYEIIGEDDHAGMPACRSTARVEVEPGRPWLHVTEVAYRPPHLDEPGGRYRYEGALVTVGDLTHIMLRDCLTRQPKVYALRRPLRESQAVWLEGEAMYIGLTNRPHHMPARFRRTTMPGRHEARL